MYSVICEDVLRNTCSVSIDNAVIHYLRYKLIGTIVAGVIVGGIANSAVNTLRFI